MPFEFPEGPAGIHPPTAALKRILQTYSVTNPFTHQPYNETFLIGIGGGLDAGYILFQFKQLPNPMVVLGFRNRWNQAQVYLQNLTRRINLDVEFIPFQNENDAQVGLQNALKDGKKAIVWIDKAFLPYHQIPDVLKGYFNYQVGVHARDGRLWRLYIDDLSTEAFEIREKSFTAGRANLPQNNFMMMVYQDNHEINLRDLRLNIIESLQDCATQLTRPVKTLGVSTLQTWAEKLTNRKDPTGWAQVFPEQKGLYPVLRSIYEAIRLDGTEGFALRKTYADYLQQAAGILDNPNLNAVAGQYLQLSNHWANLAENALPSNIPVFDRVKNLLNQQYLAYKNHKMKKFSQTLKDLTSLENRIKADFPLDTFETSQLYKRLSRQIKLIAELELSAALRLRDVSFR